ncbi:MAG: hypothetical protein AAGC70_16315 [Pseudomonadota bacterium]
MFDPNRSDIQGRVRSRKVELMLALALTAVAIVSIFSQLLAF